MKEGSSLEWWGKRLGDSGEIGCRKLGWGGCITVVSAGCCKSGLICESILETHIEPQFDVLFEISLIQVCPISFLAPCLILKQSLFMALDEDKQEGKACGVLKSFWMLTTLIDAF